VVGGYRQGFRLYWRFRSRSETVGRPATCREILFIIQRMAHENLTWGAPRIHGELLKLGVDVSERTVSRYLWRLRRNGNAGQSWRTFLKNHQESIAGMDFFTVMTAHFRILYRLFLIRHDHREIIHFNCTQHPTSEWIVQQLREAFPDSTEDQYLIFDRDAKFGAEVSTS
jgi:putative transposase